jgi:poly [ADP-ribose] polymerase 2/3/4
MATRFKERKVKPGEKDYDPALCGFTETVKFKVLHCSNVEGNNNKFYCIELQKNPKTGQYRLFSHYGRLSISEVFGVRDFDYIDNCPITDPTYLEKEIDSIVKDKQRGKTVKDDKTGKSWRENYEEVQTFAPTVGSANIRGKSAPITTSTGSKKAHVDTSSIKSAKVISIINQVVDENIHNIQACTSLTLTSNGFETPLGPVTKEHVQRARAALDSLKAVMKDDKMDPKSGSVIKANNLYFSLIPHEFGRKITEADMIIDVAKLIAEYDLLDQLESAVQMGSALNQNASQKVDALGIDIDELLETDNEFDRLRNYVANSKADNHRGLDVCKWKVRNIFTVRIPNERQRFDSSGKPLGNVKELFHGSKNCNILSIMMNGLIIPPCNAPGVTGRAFGNGIYGAHHSTKSLNYSTGWWSGSKNRYDNSFLFIVRFAMGKTFITHHSISHVPAGHDSTWAKSGSGSSLYNDEYIVYKLPQATITHLIEMSK